jgi:hypothetical protein
VLPEAARNLEPIQIRETHIEQDRVEATVLHRSKRSPAAGDDGHLVTIELEQAFGHLLIDRLILHEEQRQ